MVAERGRDTAGGRAAVDLTLVVVAPPQPPGQGAARTDLRRLDRLRDQHLRHSGCSRRGGPSRVRGNGQRQSPGKSGSSRDSGPHHDHHAPAVSAAKRPRTALQRRVHPPGALDAPAKRHCTPAVRPQVRGKPRPWKPLPHAPRARLGPGRAPPAPPQPVVSPREDHEGRGGAPSVGVCRRPGEAAGTHYRGENCTCP